MNRNTVIDKSDYEKYRIPLTFVNLFSKYKKKYICSELEKRHPCFSDDFSYFPKNKITKNGIVADVFVMNKSTLANYKNLSKKGSLVIQENNKIKVFCSRNKILILIATLSLIFIICFFSILYFSGDAKNLTINEPEQSITNMKQEKNNFNKFNKDTLCKILELIRTNSGKIKELSWGITQLGENISCGIKYIYPEVLERQFSNLRISSVSYVDNVPQMIFSINNKINLDQSANQKNNILSIKNNIREIIKKYNGKIIEEEVFPYKVTFETKIEIKEKMTENNIFTEINNCTNKSFLYVSFFSISRANINDNYFRITIIFSDNENYQNQTLKQIGTNIDLFLNNSHEIIKENTINKTNNIYDNKKINNDLFLGEVNYKSGKKLLFYKNQNGKIIKKEVLSVEKEES